MKTYHVCALIIGLCLLQSSRATAQIGSRNFSLHFGLERYAGDYLFPGKSKGPAFSNSQGNYLGIQFERRLPYRFGIGLAFSHHFVAYGATGNIFNDGFKYLLITKDKPYNYLTEKEVEHLANNGIKRLPDHLNKINSFKLEADISYDVLKNLKNDLQVVASGNINMSSSTWHTDKAPGMVVSPGLPTDTVRYIVPYEQRAFGFGYSVSIRYRYILKNGLFFGTQVSRHNLLTNNGGVYHTIGLFIGKRFLKK